jgi:hypothetical protein
LIPQEVEYDGKPGFAYSMNDEIIVLDDYKETDPKGNYIRMKIKNKANYKMNFNSKRII